MIDKKIQALWCCGSEVEIICVNFLLPKKVCEDSEDSDMRFLKERQSNFAYSNSLLNGFIWFKGLADWLAGLRGWLL